MQNIPVLAVLLLVVACTPNGVHNARAGGVSGDLATITYYDRNDDGIADLELHEPAYCDDCDWALVDTDFNGRYEKRVRWSFALLKEPVDLPVPEKVQLKVGQPSLSGWED